MNFRLRARRAGNTRELDIKWSKHSLDLLANRAVADEQDSFARELFVHDGRVVRLCVARYLRIMCGRFEAAFPFACTLHVEIERDVFE